MWKTPHFLDLNQNLEKSKAVLRRRIIIHQVYATSSHNLPKQTDSAVTLSFLTAVSSRIRYIVTLNTLLHCYIEYIVTLSCIMYKRS